MWGSWCGTAASTPTSFGAGGVLFESAPAHLSGARWTVEDPDEEHLTLSPSVVCRTCGHHGFVRAGRWVPA